MTFDEYQADAARTANTDLETKLRILVAIAGIAGEVGELANALKKYTGHGHSLEEMIDKIVDEIGDAFWYLVELCNILGIKFEDVVVHNVAKRLRRYPNGFSSADSVRRADVEAVDHD